MKKTTFLLALLFAAHFVSAQDDPSKRPSPPARVKGSIGGVSVNIDYGQPAAKGRKVFGGIVPYGQVWRTGANETTAIEFSDPVLLEGKMVPKGRYALFSIPNEKNWVIVLNKTVKWGAFSYKQEEDVLRVEVPVKTPAAYCEKFAIDVSPAGIVSLTWENTQVDFRIQTVIPFDSPRWTYTGKTLRQNWQGKDCIVLTEGLAELKDADFKNGVIEFDVSFYAERHFPGVFFRMEDSANYEIVYFRPQESGLNDAIQYIPVTHDHAAWQLYFTRGYTERADYNLGQWNHVKVVVADNRGEVFVNNMETPVLTIHQFKRTARAGGIAFGSGSTNTIRFANVSVSKSEVPVFKSRFRDEPPVEPGTITGWQVSNLIDGGALEKEYVLSSALTGGLRWTKMKTENSGLLNLAPVGKTAAKQNTVFCKVEINAAAPQLRKLTLGYSDNAHIYLNGKLLYSGTAGFRTRDEFFYGSVGAFDHFYLDLQKGKNELWIAVAEDFGGWGIKAKLEAGPGVDVAY
jgi:Protein of unknown function (DUF2911)/Domain of Unknown Function (DUF1080)